MNEHNAGESFATAPRRPFEHVFCEYYRVRTDAVRRETYLKTLAHLLRPVRNGSAPRFAEAPLSRCGRDEARM